MRERADYSVVEALNRALSAPKDYDELCKEQEDVWAVLSDNTHLRNIFHNLTSEERYWHVKTVLKAVDCALYDHLYASGDGVNRVPQIAFTVVRHAVEFLLEAGPTGRTMIAYRNRHHKFVSALAEFADRAAGGRSINDDFYRQLGRRVAYCVLDENLPEFGSADLAPESWQHERIQQAAMERLVYFVGSESGPIKIGLASDPKARLASLQTAHYEKLTILALAGGGSDAEREYHVRFAEHRLNGEWFKRHDDILSEISRLNEDRVLVPQAPVPGES